MTDYRHAGCGYPNGPVNNFRIFALPSPKLLMLVTEARYHHDEAVSAGKTVLWRAIPRIGHRPAESGWSPRKFLDEALNLTDRPSQPITDFVFANELDLQDERGDDQNDWDGYDTRYGLIGGWGYSLIPLLRDALPGTRIHWPAFTPDHHAIEYRHLWEEAARRCDVIDFHGYDSLANIEKQYYDYRSTFPDKPLALTEWHGKGNLQEEHTILQWLAETIQDDPLFDAAYFFIWRWYNHPGWWQDDWDIEHVPERERLFLVPPVEEPLPAPPPTPEEPPVPNLPTRPQGIDVASYQGFPDWAAVKAAGYSFGITKFTEGLSYINPTSTYNWQEMLRVGMKRVGYHWGRPSQDARQQVEFFWQTVQEAGGWQPGDLLDLDIEESGGDEAVWAEQFMDALDDRIPVDACLMYTGAWFTEQEGFADNVTLARYRLHLANYGRRTVPPPPAPWDRVTIWQYSSTGKVPGITGDVDLNEFQGSYAELYALGRTEQEPPVEEYSVGPGIRAKMQEQGDEPATDEVYHGDQYSEAYGKSGNHYVYLKATNRTSVFWKQS